MAQPPDPSTIPPAKVYSPEEISAIPPEIRAQLNLVPALPKAAEDDELADIPPDVLAKVRALSGENFLGEEPSGFSWAALVYGPFYYVAMKDGLFAVLSALASLLVYTMPLLIPLAFFARKRAWQRKTWVSEDQFWQTQRQWDRSAIVGAILSVVVLYFVSHYVYSMLSSTFGTSNPNAVLQQVQTQYQQ